MSAKWKLFAKLSGTGVHRSHKYNEKQNNGDAEICRTENQNPILEYIFIFSVAE